MTALKRHDRQACENAEEVCGQIGEANFASRHKVLKALQHRLQRPNKSTLGRLTRFRMAHGRKFDLARNDNIIAMTQLVLKHWAETHVIIQFAPHNFEAEHINLPIQKPLQPRPAVTFFDG